MNWPRVGDDTVRLLGGYRLGAGADEAACMRKGSRPVLIAEIVGARNIAQRQRVLDGKTYKRIV
jgi:hypothetical protein